MPELPEVEVICRGIRPHLLDRTVTAIHASGKELRRPIPLDRLRREMLLRPITFVDRRAKYLQIGVEGGARLIIHLGMTGNLGFFAPNSQAAKHDHLRWTLDNNSELRYNDSRRFGSIIMCSSHEIADLETSVFQTTGPEPFSDQFSAEYLQRLAKGKEVPVKVFIMNTRVVAGIGNIYAGESLFRAGILPTRKVRTLSGKEWLKLVTAIREILEEAIACGGSTISNFLNAHQEKGYFQVHFMVYGRRGEPCPTCRTTIENLRLGGRASYFCPRCQR